MSYSRSLESNRLEIVLIAVAILVLVSILGILILMGSGLEPPPPHLDAENHDDRPTAPQETQLDKAYSDEDETFLSSVRRKSRSLADELKLELESLQRAFVVSAGSAAERLPKDLKIMENLQKLSLDSALELPQKQYDPEMGCDSSREILVSPISVTGRDDGSREHRRKSSRMTKRTSTCRLEGQHFGGSLV